MLAITIELDALKTSKISRLLVASDPLAFVCVSVFLVSLALCAAFVGRAS